MHPLHPVKVRSYKSIYSTSAPASLAPFAADLSNLAVFPAFLGLVFNTRTIA